MAADLHFAATVSLKRESVDDFSRYPFSLPAMRNFDRIELHPKVTFFVGENGSGKSTLLEGIAVNLGLNPEGGTENFRFNTRSSHSDLHQHLRISKGTMRPQSRFFLRAESFFNVATEIERLDAEPGGPFIVDSYGGRSLHEQSHGESFWALLVNRFGSNGLYILDEPEAALSPNRQLAMLSRMHQLVEAGCQFIIATHSPILMAYPNASIFLCGSTGIESVAYQDTEHFLVTRDFLQNPERMLRILLAPGADED